MEKIANVRIGKCENSLYIRPSRMHYEQDGKQKIWDLMKIHDSVGVLICNISRQVLIFVKQFRPAVYFAMIDSATDLSIPVDTEKNPIKNGITIEFCAGIVDKDVELTKIAKEEILEECGYDVPLSSLEKITSFRSGVGVTGSNQTMYYAEVTDSQCVNKGGGNVQEGEYIEVIELSFEEARKLIYDETVPRSIGMLFGLMWFFQHKT